VTAIAARLSCPACGTADVVERFAKAGHRYVACSGCGLSRLDPRPDAAQAAALYDATYFVGGGNGGYQDYASDEVLHRANARRRLAVLGETDVRPPGRLLDVGCAHGFFLDEARRAGWGVAGVEISPEPASFARSELELDVRSSLDDVDGPFDVVTAFQVLAHVVDPDAFVAELADRLRPGGLLVVETPNAASRVARLLGRFWHLATPPSIVWMFDPATLEGLFGRSGFELVDAMRTPKEVSLGFVGSVIGQKFPRLGRPVASLTSCPALAGRAVRVDLGDEVTVIARRSAV
jgi:SAM-dependent methyltransferase